MVDWAVHRSFRIRPSSSCACAKATLRGDAQAQRGGPVHPARRWREGGIYDQLGGGFCRYSVDEYWMIPHFEKMLYDNGPLLRLYADAWLVTR